MLCALVSGGARLTVGRIRICMVYVRRVSVKRLLRKGLNLLGSRVFYCYQNTCCALVRCGSRLTVRRVLIRIAVHIYAVVATVRQIEISKKYRCTPCGAWSLVYSQTERPKQLLRLKGTPSTYTKRSHVGHFCCGTLHISR